MNPPRDNTILQYYNSVYYMVQIGYYMVQSIVYNTLYNIAHNTSYNAVNTLYNIVYNNIAYCNIVIL